jgi:coronin-7
MSRFKTSKYKNAYSYVYKKEFWINDLKVGSSLNSNGNHVKASCSFIAFNHDSTSVGTLAVLPLDSCGRFTSFPHLSAHSGFVTDFDFSPFHDDLLATGAEDCFVKLWHIPEGGVNGTMTTPTSSLPRMEARVEGLLFHPTADNILGVSSGTTVKVWDVEHMAEKYVLGGHDDTVQSFSWHGDGSLLATICKSKNQKKIRIFDPRAGSCTSEGCGHSGLKDSRVVWLGDSNYIATAGFNITRNAELSLWSTSDLSRPIATQSLGSSTGSPMLFYDEDSKMLFVAMKSESTLMFYEVTEKSPYLSQGPSVYRGTEQQKGMGMVPKRAVNVMSCQIARFLQLTQSSIIPIGYHVQRKSLKDFHGDLFPDTAGGEPALTADQWCQGDNKKVAKVSLDPGRRPKARPQTESRAKQNGTVSPENRTTTPTTKPSLTPEGKSPTPTGKPPTPDPQQSSEDSRTSFSPPAKVLNIVRSSKFRHIQGGTMHRSTHIEKLPKLSVAIPGESNAFQANRDYVAAALDIPGGQIGIFKLTHTGRQDTDEVLMFQNSANIMDFVFDPFDNHRLVVACDDARIRVWRVPDGGRGGTQKEAEFFLIGHQEKPNILCFHPQASSLLASAGYDCRLLIWDLTERTISLQMDPLPEPLLGMAWSPDGKQLATIGRDHVIRIYDPRNSTSPINEGVGPEGSRGARVVWLSNTHLVVSGFNRTSCRTLSLYVTSDLTHPLSTVSTNVSPATLVPHYDPDTHLIFLSGKGDNTIIAYEYVEDKEPYLFDVAPFACGSPHQAVCFLPKDLCDVRKVEIARAVRLCKTTVEPVFIKVPRTRMEYFQDDIYPDTRVTWQAALTAQQWLDGGDELQPCISMRPADMKPLSEAPVAAPPPKKYQSYNSNYKTDEEKKEELMSAMIEKMGDQDDDPLPQETMDGCDSDEWSD